MQLQHKFFHNIKIQQIAKIKILQIITKTNTTFTNVNLITWKWNFDYKIRYEEQCFSLPFLWIFQYKKVFFLKSNFLYTMDVSRNEESHVSVTTSLFMALISWILQIRISTLKRKKGRKFLNSFCCSLVK